MSLRISPSKNPQTKKQREKRLKSKTDKQTDYPRTVGQLQNVYDTIAISEREKQEKRTEEIPQTNNWEFFPNNVKYQNTDSVISKNTKQNKCQKYYT